MCGCESSASAGSSFRCGVKRRPLAVKPVQMLRDIFDMRRWIPVDTKQAFNTRSPQCRRLPFFFGMTRRGDAHGLFAGRITACSVIVSNLAFNCSRRAEARRRGSLKTDGPGMVFDMKYRTVSYFVAIERVDESRPKIRREVADTSTH